MKFKVIPPRLLPLPHSSLPSNPTHTPCYKIDVYKYHIISHRQNIKHQLCGPRHQHGLSICSHALVTVWLYAAQSMGQTTPGTILTRAYFNEILANLPASCPGNGFYTYNGIIRAAQLSEGFGTTGSVTDRKREVAAFLANVMHETGGLCYVREISPPRCYCTQSETYPCAPGKCYYGRGPLQLTWNDEYGAAGKAIGQDLLNHPELVSTDPTISVQTAFWYWMTNCHGRLTNGGGFASTIRCINGGECRINRKAVNARVAYYRRFCTHFNVTPGLNISC